MRLHILSDLHLEFAPFEAPATDAEVVVLAGDVHPGKRGFEWIRETFPERPVIYVLGNHEFYGEEIPRLIDDLKQQAAGTNVHVLENDRVELGGAVFLGATLWTDFRLDGDRALSEDLAAFGMSDFRCIRTPPSSRRFRPVDARRLHGQSRRWLEQELAKADHKPCVVVTHHAPSRRSVGPVFAHDPLNPAFASDLEALVASSGAALWVHGHIHYASDYGVGRTRVLNNPRGYPGEGVAGFNPALVVEV